MKKIRFMLFAIAAMAAVSCAQEIIPENQDVVEVDYVDMEFIGSLEGVTKTILDGNVVRWNGKESISIFDNSASPANTQANTVSGMSGVFTASVPEATEYYACYPYRSAAELSGSKITNCYLSQVQSPAKGSFDTGRTPMMAKMDAENNLAFRNLASHVRFTIPSDMKDVMALTLMGNDNELLTGVYDVEWNNGDPLVAPVASSASTYVTLRNGNKGAIAPGDYYFTIFPTEFKKGCTVILSKTDGTQVAVKTGKARSEVSKRNNILPMKEVASSAFKPHMNYFVHYDNGFDLKFGSFTFNNKTHSSFKYLHDGSSATEIRTNGLFFVAPGCEKITLGGGGARSQLIVVGTDAAVRSDIHISSAQGLADVADSKGEYFVLANLNCTFGIGSDGKPYNFIRANVAQFGSIVLNNCAFQALKTGFINLDAASTNNPKVVMDLTTLEISDSEIGIDYSGQAWMIMQRNAVSSCGDFIATNNVFYVCEGAKGDVTQFLLMHANNGATGGFKFGTVTLNNNTFAYTPVTSSAVTGLSAGSHTSNGNLFIDPLHKNTGTNNSAIAGYATSPSAGECINNYYYSTALNSEGKLFKLNSPGTEDGYGRKGSPVLLSSSPLSSIWNPAEGKFGAYSFTLASGTPPAYNKVGAQRSDMVPATASLDSPAAGYGDADLGTL